MPRYLLVAIVLCARALAPRAHVTASQTGPTPEAAAASSPPQGWLAPSEAALFAHVSSRCNIDRKPHISKAEFDAHYLNRKPVILGTPAPPSAQAAVLELLLRRHGDAPIPLAHPYRIGEVSPSTASIAEYLASFRALSARRAAAGVRSSSSSAAAEGIAASRTRASRVFDGLFDEASTSLYQTLGAHIVETPYEGIVWELVTALQDAAPFDESGGEKRAAAGLKGDPRWGPGAGRIASLCRLHVLPLANDTEDGNADGCTCRAHLVVASQGGSGIPFHYHHGVPANVQFIGQKHWIMTRHPPPAAQNHRRGMGEWYARAYATVAAAIDGGQEDAWECTVRAGEMIYVPDGLWHGTLGEDHELNAAVECVDGALAAQRVATKERLAEEGKIPQPLSKLVVPHDLSALPPGHPRVLAGAASPAPTPLPAPLHTTLSGVAEASDFIGHEALAWDLHPASLMPKGTVHAVGGVDSAVAATAAQQASAAPNDPRQWAPLEDTNSRAALAAAARYGTDHEIQLSSGVSLLDAAFTLLQVAEEHGAAYAEAARAAREADSPTAHLPPHQYEEEEGLQGAFPRPVSDFDLRVWGRARGGPAIPGGDPVLAHDGVVAASEEGAGEVAVAEVVLARLCIAAHKLEQSILANPGFPEAQAALAGVLLQWGKARSARSAMLPGAWGPEPCAGLAHRVSGASEPPSIVASNVTTLPFAYTMAGPPQAALDRGLALARHAQTLEPHSNALCALEVELLALGAVPGEHTVGYDGVVVPRGSSSSGGSASEDAAAPDATSRAALACVARSLRMQQAVGSWDGVRAVAAATGLLMETLA